MHSTGLDRGARRGPALEPGRRRSRAIGVGLFLAALTALAVPALVAVFVNSARGQSVEEVVMAAMSTDPRTDHVFLSGLQLVSEGAVALAIVAVLALGAARRRLDLGVGAAFLIGGANVTTQLLKYAVIERPDLGDGGGNTLPSGHVTVITSILVAGLLVLPARTRPVLVPVVAFLATCAGVGTIILNWHRPSDVVAAYAVVLGATGLTVAGLGAAGRVRPRVPGGAARVARYAGWAALAVTAVGVLILVAGVSPTYGRRDMLVAVLALAATAAACAAAIAAASYAVDLLGDGEPAPPRPRPARAH